MSSLDRPSRPRPTVAQREAAEGRLRTAAADGVLTLEEYGDRVSLVLAAGTLDELREATADLPMARAETARTPRTGPVRRWLVAVMGAHSEGGRWRPAPQTIAVAVMGGVDVDLREAVVEDGELTLTAVAVMGGIDIVVPEGVEVEMTGFAFMGGRENKARRPGYEEAPLLRVRAYALMGGVEVRNPNKKERAKADARRGEQGDQGGGATAIDDHPATWTGTPSARLPARRDNGASSSLRRVLGLGAVLALVFGLGAGPISTIGDGEGATAIFGSQEYTPDPVRFVNGGDVDANALFGSVQVIVPEGFRVNPSGGVALFGSVNSERVSAINRAAGPDAPTIDVSGRALFGSVEIVSAADLEERDRLQSAIDAAERVADQADERGDEAAEAAAEAEVDRLEEQADDLD